MTAWTRDLISSLISGWIIIGVYIDGWAHTNLRDRIEDFFTPWHAIFYSGLAAFFLWLGVLLLTLRRPGDSPQAVFGRLPVGYRAGAIGAAIFAVGGAADMFWHSLIGIETSIDALLSPPHLVLLTGVLLMATTGWRSQRVVSPTQTVPELISLASVVAGCAFFLNYLSPFRWAAPTFGFQPYQDEDIVIIWIGGIIVTTALFLVPVLWQVRDARYRLGTLSIFVATTGLAVMYAFSLGTAKDLLLAGVIGAAVGALAVEAMLDRLPWRTWRYGLPIMTGAAGFTIWGGQLVGYSAAADVLWPATLWLGVLLLGAGTGAAIGGVLWRQPSTGPGDAGDAGDAGEAAEVSEAGISAAA